MRWRDGVHDARWQRCGVSLAVELPHGGAVVVRFSQQGGVCCAWALVVSFGVCPVMLVGTYSKGLGSGSVAGWW